MAKLLNGVVIVCFTLAVVCLNDGQAFLQVIDQALTKLEQNSAVLHNLYDKAVNGSQDVQLNDCAQINATCKELRSLENNLTTTAFNLTTLLNNTSLEKNVSDAFSTASEYCSRDTPCEVDPPTDTRVLEMLTD